MAVRPTASAVLVSCATFLPPHTSIGDVYENIKPHTVLRFTVRDNRSPDLGTVRPPTAYLNVLENPPHSPTFQRLDWCTRVDWRIDDVGHKSFTVARFTTNHTGQRHAFCRWTPYIKTTVRFQSFFFRYHPTPQQGIDIVRDYVV